MPRKLFVSEQRQPNKLQTQSAYQEFILKDPGRLTRPNWTSFTLLLFRPLPYYDAATNTFEPLMSGPDELGRWILFNFQIARISNGARGATFILKHGYEPNEVLEDSPVSALAWFLRPYQQARYARAEGNLSRFEQLRDQCNDSILQRYLADNNTVVKVSPGAFVQAVVFVESSRPFPHGLGLVGDGYAPVVMMVGSFLNNFTKAISPENPGDDYKDVIDLEDGYLVAVARDGYDTRSWFPTRGRPGNNEYVVKLYKEYGDKRGPYFQAPLVEYADEIARRVTPWDDMFVLLSPEEQLSLLLRTGIDSVYLYSALHERWELPARVVNEARRRLGITNVQIQSQPSDTPNDPAMLGAGLEELAKKFLDETETATQDEAPFEEGVPEDEAPFEDTEEEYVEEQSTSEPKPQPAPRVPRASTPQRLPRKQAAPQPQRPAAEAEATDEPVPQEQVKKFIQSIRNRLNKNT